MVLVAIHSNGSMLLRSIFVKYHFKTNQGIKNLESQLAEEIAGKTQISILKICIMQLKIKNFLWTLSVQIIPYADALTMKETLLM